MEFFTYYKMAIFFVFQLVVIALFFSFMMPCDSSPNPKSSLKAMGSKAVVEVKDFDFELAKVLVKNLTQEECTLLYIHLILMNSQLFMPGIGNETAVTGREIEISQSGLQKFARRKRLSKPKCVRKIRYWSETIREHGGIRTLSQMKPLLSKVLGKIGRSDVLENTISTVLQMKREEYEDALDEIKSHSLKKKSSGDVDDHDDEDNDDFTLHKIIGVLTFTVVVMMCGLKCILSANNRKSEFFAANRATQTLNA